MRRTRPLLDGDFGFPLGAGVAVLVTLVAVAAGATTHPRLALIGLTAVSVTAAAVTTLWAALATAAMCWALDTGFVLNRYGELVFDGRAGRAAAVLTIAVLVAFAVMTALRGPRQNRVKNVWVSRQVP